jgi:hypothetical protein
MPSMKKSQKKSQQSKKGGGCAVSGRNDRIMLSGGSKSPKSASPKSKSPSPSPKKKSDSSKAYCFKCKKMVTIKDPVDSEKQTKTRLVKNRKGTCPDCGTKVSGIIGGGK